MTKCRQALFAAVSSTVCAVIWLVNSVLDVTMKLETPGQTALHMFSTAVWAACAVVWWLRWKQERRAAG